MQAKDVMTEDVICLDSKSSIFDAAELLIGAASAPFLSSMTKKQSSAS